MKCRLELAPTIRRVGRTQRLGNEARARGEHRFRRAEFLDIAARNSKHRHQPLQRCLRMAEAAFGALWARISDLGPGGIIDVAIQTGEHDGARRMMRDCGEQPRRRFVCAGRTERDHRALGGAAAQSRYLALGESDLPSGAIDEAALPKNLWPLLDCHIKEVCRDAPELIELAGARISDALPRHIFYYQLVDNIGEVAS